MSSVTDSANATIAMPSATAATASTAATAATAGAAATTSKISFDRAFGLYRNVSDAECAERIKAARAKLGKDVVLLVHHYQRPDIYCYADLTGDSLKLSRLAAQLDSKYIVFCGVHFMAEVADILSKPTQTVVLPDLAAGCSMADMANLVKVERCWRELSSVLD